MDIVTLRNFFFISILIYVNQYGWESLFVIIQKFYESLHKSFLIITNYDSSDDEEIEFIQKMNNKYEDKYLQEIRNIPNEWNFSEDEKQFDDILFQKISNQIKEEIEEKIDELCKKRSGILEQIETMTNKHAKYISLNELKHADDIQINITEKNTRVEEIDNQLIELEYIKTDEKGNDKLYSQVLDRIYLHNKFNKLKNSCVIEKTPIGNVLMKYDDQRETFTYYSDINIPYRYLEVVARKYVKFFNCVPLYIDMEEELKRFEEKWEEERVKKEEQEKISKKQNSLHIEKPDTKKGVFAQFKKYNKNAGGGNIHMVAPPKNNITSQQIQKENERVILKEKANRYTYAGKICYFDFLKKIDKKVNNKKLGLSFADFKKMNTKN